MKLLSLLLCSTISLLACSNDDNNNGVFDSDDKENIGFVNGADISWVTEMEDDGCKFYNEAGEETDCFRLMKEAGMNAIRLRVWVSPEKRYEQSLYSGKADVVNKAVRAKEAGLDVMIDFHYSDFFADPGRQWTPKDWENKSLSKLKDLVKNHTVDVLQTLKEQGVVPVWVQVGNETRNGMLHPVGQLWNEEGDIADGWSNYAALSNAGYEAVKSIFPDAKVLIHLNNAVEENSWWFKNFQEAGGKFDMIALSHYPQTSEEKSGIEMNTLALNHIRALANMYHCKVMVSEIGVKSEENEALAAQVLEDFMTKVRKMNQCAGVFYWEPQVYGGWKPALYDVLEWGAYDMGAFTVDGKPAAAMKAFKNVMP